MQPRCDALQQRSERILLRHSVVAAVENASVLVCMSGQARGDATVHQSMHTHLVLALQAHLAIMCDEAECAAYGPLLSLARHVWQWKAPPPDTGWNSLIAKRGQLGARAMQIAERAPTSEAMMAWGQTTGRDGRLRNASGAAVMEARAQLLDRLLANRLLDASSSYSWFVFTRPDHFFLCDHPRLDTFSAADITVAYDAQPPIGTAETATPYRNNMNQINDRHAVVKRVAVPAYLGELRCAIRWTVATGRLYCVEPPTRDPRITPGGICNVESTLAACLRQARVAVHRVSFSHVLVATAADRTRWSVGTWLYLQNESLAQLRLERPDVRTGLLVGRGVSALLQQPQHRWRLATQALVAAMPEPRELLMYTRHPPAFARAVACRVC